MRFINQMDEGADQFAQQKLETVPLGSRGSSNSAFSLGQDREPSKKAGGDQQPWDGNYTFDPVDHTHAGMREEQAMYIAEPEHMPQTQHTMLAADTLADKALLHSLASFIGSEPDNVRLLDRVVSTLADESATARNRIVEERIGHLLDVYLQSEPISPTEEAIERDNAKLRARYLESVPTFSALDLSTLAGSTAGNRSALASAWKKDRKVFAVQVRGIDRFPAFQFAEGRPKRVIRQIIAALPDDMSPWQIAFWFWSGNGWLGGAAPQDQLHDETAVLDAARSLSEPAVG